jgi:hypothetical protein
MITSSPCLCQHRITVGVPVPFAIVMRQLVGVARHNPHPLFLSAGVLGEKSTGPGGQHRDHSRNATDCPPPSVKEFYHAPVFLVTRRRNHVVRHHLFCAGRLVFRLIQRARVTRNLCVAA